MKKQLLLGLAVCGLALVPNESKAADVNNYMNANNVIIPSTQYSPETPYTAKTWVIVGEAYTDDMYNVVLGVPADDADGHKWYEPEYSTEYNEESAAQWEDHTSPFYDNKNAAVQDGNGYGYVTPNVMGEFYGRRTFTLTEELPLENIILACGHDDAPCEYYINGVLVCEVAEGWENGMLRLLNDEQKALIKTDGTENVLAFHVHQNWGGAFADCGLYYADMFYKDLDILLPSTREVKEQWPCEYFLPEDNGDLELYETDSEWFKPGYNFEDLPGSDFEWIESFGPLGNDAVWDAETESWLQDEDGNYLRAWNGVTATYWEGSWNPILVRRYFDLTAEQVESLNNGSRLVLSASFDEWPKFYLNGEFICSWEKWNDGNYYDHYFTPEENAFAQEGQNMMAVSLLSGNGGSHIDYSLKLEKRYDPAGVESVAIDTKPMINDNRIFDLQGRFVGTDMDKLGRGIYIKGGKKVLINK